MNSKRFLLYLSFILCSIALSHPCRAGGEDVVYLRNGSVYRGVIVDQEAGESYTIRIFGGSTIVVAVADVQKVRRERATGPIEYEYDAYRQRDIRVRRRSQYFDYRQRGFTMQWQTIVGLIDGMRLTCGYRFNRFAALGVSGGFEYGNSVNQAHVPYAVSNGYFPILLCLSGDVLKERLTPFYSFEIGYTFPMNKLLYDPGYDGFYYGPTPPNQYVSYGGVTSGAGFGLRKYLRHISFLLSLNMNVGYLRIQTTYNSYDNLTHVYSSNAITANWLSLQPSLRFGLCF